jgi:hypothetical protein
MAALVMKPDQVVKVADVSGVVETGLVSPSGTFDGRSTVAALQKHCGAPSRLIRKYHSVDRK